VTRWQHTPGVCADSDMPVWAPPEHARLSVVRCGPDGWCRFGCCQCWASPNATHFG
jgi:hypothetical protein